jgi:uncharacterized RDD family membrane protein YckC
MRATYSDEHGLPSHLARLLAFTLDSLLLSVVADLISIVAFGLFAVDIDLIANIGATRSGPSLSNIQIEQLKLFSVITVGAYLMPAALFHLFFEGSFLAATPGKMIYGLKVANPTGEDLGAYGAFKRFMIKGSAYIFPALMVPVLTLRLLEVGAFSTLLAVLGVATFLINGLIPGLAIIDRHRRGIHDLVAESRVIATTEVTLMHHVAILAAILGVLLVRRLTNGLF